MKVLFDISNLLYASFQSHWKKNEAEGRPLKDLENLCRHIILTTIYVKINDFNVSQSDVFIAVDSSSWRKDFFPYYKHKRKISREKSEIDLELMFEFFNNFLEELDTLFPFNVIKIDKCEADDIIGVLAKHIAKTEEVIIVSADKDFLQLIEPRISLFSPFQDDFITEGKIANNKFKVTNKKEALKYKLLHILVGDRTDGIMNFLSPDHILAFPKMIENKNGKKIQERQKPFGWKTIERELLDENGNIDMEKYKAMVKQSNETKKYWVRNKKLIDLTEIPKTLQKNAIEKYNECIENPKSFNYKEISKYFIINELVELKRKLMFGELIKSNIQKNTLFKN